MVLEHYENYSITMPSSKIVFFEGNSLSHKSNANLVGSVEHPISKVCSLFAAVRNAVGLALSSRSGYARILCLADELSTIALGIENNRDMTFNFSIPSDEKGWNESWDSVLGKLWHRKAGKYSHSYKYIKTMRFLIKKTFAVSCIKCCITLIDGVYPVNCGANSERLDFFCATSIPELAK